MFALERDVEDGSGFSLSDLTFCAGRRGYSKKVKPLLLLESAHVDYSVAVRFLSSRPLQAREDGRRVFLTATLRHAVPS